MDSCTLYIHVQRPYTWGGWGPPWPKYFLRAVSRREACEWQSGSMHKQGAPCVPSTQHKHCTLATVLWNTSWYLVTVLCTTAGQARTESLVHTWIVNNNTVCLPPARMKEPHKHVPSCTHHRLTIFSGDTLTNPTNAAKTHTHSSIKQSLDSHQ